MNDTEYKLVFERDGSAAYFKLNRRGQTALPGLTIGGGSFSWELDGGLINTGTNTEALLLEERAMGKIAELPIVRAVVVEYRAEYKIYKIIINYNNPDEEIEMLDKLNEIYDALGDDKIVVEYDPVPDTDLIRTKGKGLTILTE